MSFIRDVVTLVWPSSFFTAMLIENPFVIWCLKLCIIDSNSLASAFSTPAVYPTKHTHGFIMLYFAWVISASGIGSVPRHKIKISSYQYRNCHYKDKTVSWPSHLYNGNTIPVKTVFILRRARGELFIHLLHGSFGGIGAILWLFCYQWSNPVGYG